MAIAEELGKGGKRRISRSVTCRRRVRVSPSTMSQAGPSYATIWRRVPANSSSR